MRILGISGSLRRGSHNRKLLRAAAAALPPGVELTEWDGLAALPAYDEDLESHSPPPVRDFLSAIEHADALPMRPPEFNESLNVAVKNDDEFDSVPIPSGQLRYNP